MLGHKDPKTQLSPKAALLAGGALLFVIGLYGALSLAVVSRSTVNRPTVTATLTSDENGTVLEAHVAVSGLSNREHVLIRVEGVRDPNSPLFLADGRTGRTAQQPDPDGRDVDKTCNSNSDGNRCQLLLGERVGPDSEGNVDVTIDVPVHVGLYGRVSVVAMVRDAAEAPSITNCNTMSEDIGCAGAFLPPAPTHPRVNASWDASKPPRLQVAVKLAGLAPDDVVVTQVFDANAPDVPLSVMTSVADQHGTVDASLPVAVDPSIKRVCIRAEVVVGGSLAYQSQVPADSGCDNSSLVGSVLVVQVPLHSRRELISWVHRRKH